MKVLLLGADGQVGHELCVALSRAHDLVCANRSGQRSSGAACERIDLSNPNQLHATILRIKPDWIVNAAAYTAVDKAESEFELAWAINAQALKVIALAADDIAAGVLHYSTDYVFNGSAKHPYAPLEAVEPVNRYGETKLAGELFLRESGVPHVILRTQWVYAARGHNFLRTMLRLGAERESLSIVDDQRGSPTPARLIAHASACVLAHEGAREMRATHHLVSAGDCTWFDFAEAIFQGALERGLITQSPALQRIQSKDFPTAAKRPAYSVLDTDSFRRTFAIELPDWRMGLNEILDELSNARLQGVH